MSVSLPDTYGAKPADAFSPVLFIFALEYATGKVRVNLERVELNVTHMLLVSADDVILLADSVYVIYRKREIKEKRNLYFCCSIMRWVLWEWRTWCKQMLLRRSAEVIGFYLLSEYHNNNGTSQYLCGINLCIIKLGYKVFVIQNGFNILTFRGPCIVHRASCIVIYSCN